MDLSHSGCHLPGRLAVLVLRDGDKTPVSSAWIGGGLPSGGRGREGGGRRTSAWGKLPWNAEMFCNNANLITRSLKWWWGAIQDSVGGTAGDAARESRCLQTQGTTIPKSSTCLLLFGRVLPHYWYVRTQCLTYQQPGLREGVCWWLSVILYWFFFFFLDNTSLVNNRKLDTKEQKTIISNCAVTATIWLTTWNSEQIKGIGFTYTW